MLKKAGTDYKKYLGSYLASDCWVTCKTNYPTKSLITFSQNLCYTWLKPRDIGRKTIDAKWVRQNNNHPNCQQFLFQVWSAKIRPNFLWCACWRLLMKTVKNIRMYWPWHFYICPCYHSYKIYYCNVLLSNNAHRINFCAIEE